MYVLSPLAYIAVYMYPVMLKEVCKMGKVNNSKMVKYYDVAGGDNCLYNASTPAPVDPSVIINDNTMNNLSFFVYF